MKVKFKEEDLNKLIYWIVCKFKEDQFHHQAASAKSDLIGGFFDRWFNRAPEFLIFRELLKGKNYDVIIDNFLYGQDTKKNAPDIIGLKGSKGSILAKFALFENGEWIKVKDMPLIEVKTFRKTQALTAVGETQVSSDHFCVFVESHVPNDYLITLFKEKIFDKKILESLKGDYAFIKSDKNNQLIPIKEPKIDKDLGFFKLIGIFKGDIVKKFSILVSIDKDGKPQKPRYFSKIEEIEPIKHNCEENVNEGLFKLTELVPFYIKFTKPKTKVKIVKKLKSYFVIKIEGDAEVNGTIIRDGYFKILFKKFDRSSKKKEYIGDKKVFEFLAEDSTNKLISRFDEIVKKAE